MGGDSLSGEGTTIAAVHPDILQTHILTRLDGPTLAAAASASSQLHELSAEDNLWREICHHTWPSSADPHVRRLISTFPAGHRSFFSDSFPALDHRRRSQPNRRRHPPPAAVNLTCAVDIYYKNRILLSKACDTDKQSDLFSPFRIELLGRKETVPMPVEMDITDDICQSDLEENLTLSWILIDPTRTHTRAATISSLRPVSVDRNWLTNDVDLRYMTVLSGEKSGEFVQCAVVVTCGGREGGGLVVKEVNLHVEDMDGKKLSGKDSLVILQEALESGKRRRGKNGEERERYQEWLRMKRERRERKRSRESRMELALIATGVAIFLAFWMFIAIRILQLLRLI